MRKEISSYIYRLTICLFSSVDILHDLFDDEAIWNHRSTLLMKFLEHPTSLLPAAEHVELERLAQESARFRAFPNIRRKTTSKPMTQLFAYWLFLFLFDFFPAVLVNEHVNGLPLVVS